MSCLFIISSRFTLLLLAAKSHQLLSSNLINFCPYSSASPLLCAPFILFKPLLCLCLHSHPQQEHPVVWLLPPPWKLPTRLPPSTPQRRVLPRGLALKHSSQCFVDLFLLASLLTQTRDSSIRQGRVVFLFVSSASSFLRAHTRSLVRVFGWVDVTNAKEFEDNCKN